MTYDGHKSKAKLPPQIYSKAALFVIQHKLVIGIAIYVLIFFVWPFFQGPDLSTTAD